MGLSILLHAGHPLTLAFAAAVAIASKFLLRIDGKHVFNPGMLGIVAAVALTGDADQSRSMGFGCGAGLFWSGPQA
ncbi:MAG: hypothetical protein R2810_05110 [Flavobacteriales bacterium]